MTYFRIVDDPNRIKQFSVEINIILFWTFDWCTHTYRIEIIILVERIFL